MPPETPRTTRRPCHGFRAARPRLRRAPAAVDSGSGLTSRNHDAAAPFHQPEMNVLSDKRFQRTSGQLLFQSGRNGVLGQSIQLASVARSNQYAQVLAAVGVACGFGGSEDTHL